MSSDDESLEGFGMIRRGTDGYADPQVPVASPIAPMINPPIAPMTISPPIASRMQFHSYGPSGHVSFPLSYDVWSNCMKVYLLGQDLWDVIEPESEPKPKPEPEESSKTWRRKNALALHAIHVSCGEDALSKIGNLELAKEAWDLLRSINIINHPPSDHKDHDHDHDSDGEVLDDHKDHTQIVEEPISNSNVTGHGEKVKEPSSKSDDIDYKPFVKATNKGDWKAMKKFLDSHPKANIATMVKGRTALHYLLDVGNLEIGGRLLEKMNSNKDLEILDDNGFTAFARLSCHNQPGVLKLLERMVERNKKLPNIGNAYTIPVVMASWKGFKDTTRYLYSVTDVNILNPRKGNIGVHLLINCINIGLFDIALKIVMRFPRTLKRKNNEEVYPIYALAKSFCALKNERHAKSRAFNLSHWVSKSWKNMKRCVQREDDEKLVYFQAQAFLGLVCDRVKDFDETMLKKYVCAAMVEASKHGSVEFVSKMILANPNLIEAHVENKTIFWHAVENRQEKVYHLIYSYIGQKDDLLSRSNPEKNNILHLVANSASSAVLNRISGPALQMQNELQWFKEVWSLAKPRYREDTNIEGLTPRELFTKSHEKLIESGEQDMKYIAQSSTVVGALIFTVMFAAAFTVPGGNNSDTGLPVFLKRSMFRIFIVCDALSLYSSTTSVLVFLVILTSRYAEDDFLVKLPRKLMIGLATLFFSIITMMMSFCMALALMLDGRLRYILPTVLLAIVPIVIFMSSVVPVLLEMFVSTYRPSISNRTRKVLENSTKVMAKPASFELEEKEVAIVKEKRVKAKINPPKVGKKFASIKEDNDPSSVVDTNASSENWEEGSLLNGSSSVDEIV